MAKEKKPRLGRGLSSLIPSVPVGMENHSDQAAAARTEFAQATAVTSPSPINRPTGWEHQGSHVDVPRGTSAHDTDRGPLIWLAPGLIVPNPYQPRRTFDGAALAGLAESLKQDGVMQPIIVRQRKGDGGMYELVAGERRWRAARIAAIATVPALVKDLTDRQLAEWAVIENVQREDLNAMDQAEAFARLAGQFNLTHEQIAQRVGFSRAAVTNITRLLDLDQKVQDAIRAGLLSLGHGKVLLSVPSTPLQWKLAEQAIGGQWSVRAIEAAVSRALEAQTAPRTKVAQRATHLADVEKQLSTQLNTKVRIKSGRQKNAGTLQIDYYSLDEFDALLGRLGVRVE